MSAFGQKQTLATQKTRHSSRVFAGSHFNRRHSPLQGYNVSTYVNRESAMESGTVEVDGETFDWEVDNERLITVTHPDHADWPPKVTQVGGTRPRDLAMILAAEMLRENRPH